MAGTILSTKKTENGVALSVQVWKEGPAYVAYSPELDISSCGNSAVRAKSALREAVTLFVEEAARMGTREEILAEAGFERRGNTYRPRPILARDKIRLAIPAA